MAKKIFTYRGKTLEEIKKMSLTDFIKLAPARIRRSLKRGFTDPQKDFINKLKKKKNVKTHCRNIVIIPDMIGHTIRVYTGKEFIPVTVTEEMLGHYLGEFILTRKRVAHSAPGVGATRSSSNISAK